MLIANIFLKNGEVISYDRFSKKRVNLRAGLWPSLKNSIRILSLKNLDFLAIARIVV